MTLSLCVLQLPGRPEAAGCQRLPTDRAGHPADEGQDDRNRRGTLLLQKPQLQVSQSTIYLRHNMATLAGLTLQAV